MGINGEKNLVFEHETREVFRINETMRDSDLSRCPCVDDDGLKAQSNAIKEGLRLPQAMRSLGFQLTPKSLLLHKKFYITIFL